MLDAHIHLQDIPSNQRRELISYLCDQNFCALFCNGTSPADWQKVLSFADLVGIIKPFIGIHPWFVDRIDPNWEADFVHSLRHDACGIGEIGLDGTPKGGDFERQKILLVRQLDMAVMFGRAFVLHCVKAWEPMMTILRSYDFHGVPFIVHSYIGPAEILQELLAMGARISISQRSLGQKGAEEIIRLIPDRQLLTETDFPYLPGKDRTQVTVDDYRQAILEVYNGIAAIRGIDREVLEQQIRENAREILRYL